ncbi:hypothetical protein WJ06_04890 [Burkholderia cepacia]|nr:hypothetical protein WJ06_04890 [Burkholderia cepacia]RQT51314.1 hypothetical protein DF050_16815 [Burkholderia cepacia]
MREGVARQATTGSDDLKRRPCSEIHEAMKRTGVRRGASRRASMHAARIDAETVNAARSGRRKSFNDTIRAAGGKRTNS